MRVGIIGGGSIGLLFGAYLGQSHEVTVFTRREEQAQKIRDMGISLFFQEAGEKVIETDAAIGESGISDQDILIIAVKQYDLSHLMSLLSSIPKEIPLCFIQNGMGHLEFLNTLPQEEILVAAVEHGAKRLDDRTVSHNGAGQTNVSVYKGNYDMEERFPKSSDPRFPVCFHDDYRTTLINKLMANALINPLTVIFQVKNGRLVDNPYYYELLKLMFEEIYSIFPLGNKEELFNSIVGICKNTKQNTSSMLKDIQEGRKTEIDAILGYILKIAEKKGAKLKAVQMAYVMVKGIEQERR
ncbi:2-dehydropantoate 2-reductase [Siminovitchia fortis]|uniref:2-dehydropantoate 2-reductase n=1 Tax=Siminovitchia fortis TaxID=254758 RepID=UPI00119F0BE2|nr:2-dehydropantoate 2-reductase [Siminovitchia fortis]